MLRYTTSLFQVSNWYDLVIFTASMEIYGAAVADKLDNGRNILNRRYYRQHCTPDFGSYTKDLSAICSDLNRVTYFFTFPQPLILTSFLFRYLLLITALELTDVFLTMRYRSNHGFPTQWMYLYCLYYLYWMLCDSLTMFVRFYPGICK